MFIRVIDLETTGMPPDAAVCEVGWSDMRPDVGNAWSIMPPQAMLVSPGRPMPPEARAVHHIGDADLEHAPQATTAFLKLMDGAEVFCAHNAAFERQFFAGGDVPWICTFKCARRVWPELPSFSNQFLRYWLGLELDDALAMPPHRAGPDTHVTAHILLQLMRLHAVKQLIEWTAKPTYYHRVPMTKHKGQLWSDVDYGLLRWFQTADCDEDIKAAARDEMNLRDRERDASRF